MERAKGREVHLAINHSCFVKVSTTHLVYKTHHGSYRKIVQKLVQVQLLPGQAVLPSASAVIAIPTQSNAS